MGRDLGNLLSTQPSVGVSPITKDLLSPALDTQAKQQHGTFLIICSIWVQKPLKRSSTAAMWMSYCIPFCLSSFTHCNDEIDGSMSQPSGQHCKSSTSHVAQFWHRVPHFEPPI